MQALGERRVLVTVTGYPRGGAPGPGRSLVTRATRSQSLREISTSRVKLRTDFKSTEKVRGLFCPRTLEVHFLKEREVSRRGGQLSSLPARRPPEKGRCSRQWGTRCPHHRRPLMSMPCQTCRCAPARPSSRRTVQGTMEETGKVRGRQADAVTIVLCTAGVWAAAQPAPRRAEGGQGPPQVCADSLVPEK